LRTHVVAIGDGQRIKKLSFLVHPDLNAGISPPGDLRSQLHGERARSGQNDPILNLFDSILIVVATADAAMSAARIA
jgi:hypothetical protein